MPGGVGLRETVMIKRFTKLMNNSDGATAIEYGLIAALTRVANEARDFPTRGVARFRPTHIHRYMAAAPATTVPGERRKAEAGDAHHEKALKLLIGRINCANALAHRCSR